MTVAREEERISNGKKPVLVTKTESTPVLCSSLIISLKLIATKNIYLLPCYCRIYFKAQIPIIRKMASSLSHGRAYRIVAYLVIGTRILLPCLKHMVSLDIQEKKPESISIN